MNAFLLDSADEPTAVGTPAYAGGPPESFGASNQETADPDFQAQLADTPNPQPTVTPTMLFIGAGLAAMFFFGRGKHR